MLELNDLESGLVIVAHPDDETIWCGGLLLTYPNCEWTIISLCRRDDANRQPKFIRACSRFGATALISDLDDGNPLAEINPEREIGWRIRQWTDERDWDLILTHGWNGEYGHERHIETHLVVADLVRKDELSCRELWTFAYSWDEHTTNCRPADDADVELPLSANVLATKEQIIEQTYGYGQDYFETRSCLSPETFYHLHV